jgi:hypothetical protein
MSRVLRWSATRMTRRSLLGRVAATTFGVYAGLAAGKIQVAYAAACSGTPCASCNCSGRECVACGSVACQDSQAGSCTEHARCWFSNGAYCCDCACRDGSFGYQCYCYAP